MRLAAPWRVRRPGHYGRPPDGRRWRYRRRSNAHRRGQSWPDTHQAHTALGLLQPKCAAGHTIPCPGGDGFSPAPRGINKIPDTDTTDRSARSFSAPLRALQFEGRPQFSGREQIVILINLRLFQERVLISGTLRSKAASLGGLETAPAWGPEG